jgi:hypothetical protein
MKNLIAILACLFACSQAPVFAGDKFYSFEYFFSPVPGQLTVVQNQLKKLSLTSSASADPLKAWLGGTWVLKPNVTVVFTAFDKHGTPSAFKGVGAGISYQREVNVNGTNKVKIEVNADWLVFDEGNGPALTVGALGGSWLQQFGNPCVGAAYNVKTKAVYALISYSGAFGVN